MKNNLKNLREAIHQMFVAWRIKKLEVYDSETKESWNVKTLDPDHFQEFYDALDLFLRRFEGFQKELEETKALAEKVLRNEKPSHFRSEAKGALDEIEEILGVSPERG